MKKTKRYLINNAILAIVFLSTIFYAFSSGTTGKTALNGNGCFCHSETPSSAVTVVVDGPDILTPNQTAEYTLTIAGGPLTAGGTNIAASAGTLAPGTGLRLAFGELTHISPMTPSGGMVSFTFSFTAPDTGTAVLYAAGNSVNLNGSSAGDAWNFSTPKTITVSPVVNVDDEILATSFSLEQNYPNPFNPSTVINYQIPMDASGELVNLKVFDLLGREVAELVNEIKTAGTYKLQISMPHHYQAGCTSIRLQQGNMQQ
jgi:hypothetical protein